MTQLLDKAVKDCVRTVIQMDARRAVKYLAPDLTVAAAAVLYNGKLPRKNYRSRSIVVTIGRPNFEARAFIKRCKAAGEPFPVKKIQLKFPPKRPRVE
jgi:hypothetical protein